MTAEKKNTTAVAKKSNSKEIMDYLMEASQGAILDKSYGIEPAVKSMFIVLQSVTDKNGKGVLEACTPNSIKRAGMSMLLDNANPIKGQCYFIIYGGELKYMREYHVNIKLAIRDSNAKSFTPVIVYDKDEFEYIIKPSGKKVITKHIQDISNIDINKIKAAYCVIEFDDTEETDAEIMTMVQCKQSWLEGATKGEGKFHKKYTDQAVIRTLINRATKTYVRSSDDSELVKLNPQQGTIQEKETINVEYEDVSSPSDEPNIEQEKVQEQASELTKADAPEQPTMNFETPKQ